LTNQQKNPGRAPLTRLLDAVDCAAARADEVTLRDVLNELGQGAFLTIILVVAALLVSPLSGIPGFATLAAVLIVLLSAQAIAGRRTLWLPDVVMRRRIKATMLVRATRWLRRPATWIDRHARRRLLFLTRGAARTGVLVLCILIALTWPLLEFVPTTSSLTAAVIVLLTFGLVTRDGAYVLAGLCVLAVVGTGAAVLVEAAVT
jgi:hypothetical protein